MVVEVVVRVCTISYMLLCMYIHALSDSVPTLSRVRFSPSLMYISTISLVSHVTRPAEDRCRPRIQHDNVVRIYLTTTGRQTQAVPHPRPVTDLIWRNSPTSSR